MHRVYMHLCVFRFQFFDLHSWQLAEEKRLELWRSNCPELRDVGARERQRGLPQAWDQQVQLREEVHYT